MQRREFLAGGAASLMTAALAPSAARQEADFQSVLENNLYRIEVDRKAGLIVSLLDKRSRTELITEPRLADNFRLLLPLPDLEANYVMGREQLLSSSKAKGDVLELQWSGPLTNQHGSYALSVSLRIELVQESIEFRLSVRNDTQHRLAEAWYPILGGFEGLGERSETKELTPFMGGTTETDLFREFPSMLQLGIPVPECFWSYPFPMPMPWIDIYNRRLHRGMYFGCHDTTCRFKTVRYELHPGLAERHYGGNWPRPEQLTPETPLGLKLHWTHFPYTHPGQTFEGPPVVVQFHDGDWHEGARIYRHWFKSNFQICEPRAGWISREMAFQDTMFLLPEGNILWKFTDIPRWARGALDYGVKSVLISGWNVGGHDSHYPAYEPDPRLGTWEELREGIRECHNMGVRVFFFANIQPVDCATEAYRKHLSRFASMDPWGCIYDIYGFGMGSLGARLGFTRRPLVNVSPAFPEFRKIIVTKLTKLAEAGADGIHIDKMWPIVGLDFNPNIPTSPDQATSEGKLRAADELLKACRSVNPDFCLSTECAWDRTLSYANVAWAWHAGAKDHVPALKFTFSEWLPGLAASQPYDYTAINNAVRYGYQIFLGPGNYTESMKYAPMGALSAYVAEILQLREAEKETLYFGEFLDSLGIQVKGPEEVRSSSFRDPKTGRRACVLVNAGQSSCQASLVAFDGNSSGAVRVRTPFQKLVRSELPIVVEIPSERLVIVAEDV